MFAIANTDLDWFGQLRNDGYEQTPVNFWTPTPWNIKKLQQGNRLYFMLKSPIRKIGGYGKFREYKNMSTTEAWNKYGKNNGVESLDELEKRTKFYSSKRSINNLVNEIGCILLEDINLFDDSEFTSPESLLGVGFSKQIVKIKYYEESEGQQVASHSDSNTNPDFESQKNFTKEKKLISQAQRVGQGKFRDKILTAYKNTCAISGIIDEISLEAAHIEGYVNEASNHIKNGICLRADIHKLFDRHLLAIDRDFTIFVSSQVKDNEYKQFNGKKLSLPSQVQHRPDREILSERFKSFRK